MSAGIFACKITDHDIVAACAPEQPESVVAGQEWMRTDTGSVLPVRRVRSDYYIDLGGGSYTIVLSPEQLRAGWVCIDAPDNVVPFAAAPSGCDETKERT